MKDQKLFVKLRELLPQCIIFFEQIVILDLDGCLLVFLLEILRKVDGGFVCVGRYEKLVRLFDGRELVDSGIIL